MAKARGHAIVFAWPGQGHLNPLLRFSDFLLREGCQVTFVHSHHNLSRLRNAAQAQLLVPQGEDQAVNFAGIDDGIPNDQPRDLSSLIKATDSSEGGLVVSFGSLVARLVQEAQNAQPSPALFIVSDFFMAFTQDVANKHSLPRIAVYVQSATSFACHVAVAQGFRPQPDYQWTSQN